MKALLATASAVALLIGGATLANAADTAMKDGKATPSIQGKVQDGQPAAGGATVSEAQPTEPLPAEPNSPADKNAKMLNDEGAATGAGTGTGVTPPAQNTSIPDKQQNKSP